MRPAGVVQLVASLGYAFKDPALLVEALTHRSFAHERPSEGARHNERLEFLGDAVLELVVRHRLLRAHPYADEGTLSRIRSTIVNGQQLADTAARLGVADAVRLGPAAEKTGTRARKTVLAGAMEALLGAIYVDGGLAAVDTVVGHWLEDALADAGEGAARRDFKTELQMLVQKHLKEVPTYRTTEDRGEGHEDRFLVELVVEGRVVTAASGRNKKEATQRAAAAGLSILEVQWAGR
ncbi:MAG: ribonuclease III [Deltaproteobacteria bacterium]|nr:ribonuclease III [Deltaproteobacteria bacterium]